VTISDGGLWVIAGANEKGAVWRIDPVTAEVQQKIALSNPSFWNEMESEDGAIWVTSSPTVHENGVSLVRLYRIDPSASEITAAVPLGDGLSVLGPGERAASLATLAVGEGSVWTFVDSEGLVLRIAGRARRVNHDKGSDREDSAATRGSGASLTQNPCVVAALVKGRYTKRERSVSVFVDVE
jgi:hypothetical protein